MMLTPPDGVGGARCRSGHCRCRDLSSRTPARLIACLARWPLVSAPLAEAETGASRAAVQRDPDLLVARGLAREVTGQGRYGVWAGT